MFLVGENTSHYFALGGNQNNRVCVAPMDKKRFTAESFRWPSTWPLLQGHIDLPYMRNADDSGFVSEA